MAGFLLKKAGNYMPAMLYYACAQGHAGEIERRFPLFTKGGIQKMTTIEILTLLDLIAVVVFGILAITLKK